MTETGNTASPNVHILDDAFFIPQLNRYRRIWMYLPKDYETSKKRYPVLYMHDGQNLFDNATAFSGEWEVDETLDASPNPCIVIGIDNGGLFRMTEYNPNDTEVSGKGEGRLYLEFIVRTLKPYVDKKLRTRRSKKDTAIAGSSMGGLISFYAGMLYPRVFGGIGVFSPSFWITQGIGFQIEKLVSSRKHAAQRYYFYGGGAENPTMVKDILEVAELMKTKASATVEVSINPDGWHNEFFWRKEFLRFYEWLVQVKH